MSDRFENARSRVAVAVRIGGLGHCPISGGVVEQAHGFADDRGGFRADEFHRPGGNAFGALGGVAHHQHRFAEAGGFFLHAAGVGECEAAGGEQGDEFAVGLRRDQADVFEFAQASADDRLHVRVEMHWVDEEVVRVPGGERGERVADLLEAAAEVLAAVAGDEDKRARAKVGADRFAEAIGERRLNGRIRLPAELHEQGVDHGVAGDDDLRLGDAFAAEVVGGGARGSEVECGEWCRQDTVCFFGEG